MAASTPRSLLENAATRPAYGRRWARWATDSTTPYAKAFSPPWNANCSTAPASKPRPRRMAVFDFIEGWYNPHRRHSALDYLSPIDYERAYAAQPGAPCSDKAPLKESAPPPLAGGEIRKEPDTIKATSAGESLTQLPSPTPSTESG